MDRLQEQISGGWVRNVLKGLPIEPEEFYNEFYGEAIERIKKPSNHFSRLAINVLAWISRAQRPLQKVELQHALAVIPGKKSANEHKGYLTPMGPLVGCCAGLVEIDTQNVVRLTHPTVQEYLDKCSDTLFPEADVDIARTCLTYLCFDAFSENTRVSGEDLKARLQLFPFLDYAVLCWSHHLRGQPEKELKGLTLSLLNNDSNFSNFKQVWNPRYSPQFSPGMTGLHIAANFGLELIVSSLLASEGVDVDSKDDKYGQTPLSWAAENGHEAVVKLLLEKGADMESKSNNGRTPLSWAAKNGREAVVRLLLEKGADVESESNNGQTPLSWATRYGHEAVVKMLLEKGADVESKSNKGQTPLSWAAEYGHEAVVKMLLEKEADVESKDTMFGQTLLSWAAENGREAVVKLLLEKGADV
jgi:hypothetical protein